MQEAEKYIIQYEQGKAFQLEINSLRRGKPCAKSSSLCKLDPVLDQGILRVGGRLSKMVLSTELKNPAILPKTSHISTLNLQQIHLLVGHSGRAHMLSKLHERYWLPSANAMARKIIKRCIFCRRYQAKVEQQKMVDLPHDRVTPDEPPFTHVGVDYFGPIEVKRGQSLVKRYGVIFTCLACRSVHLEVASQLDTDSCINALRRFICRRGPVSNIRSDHGTNFIGANRELREALEKFYHSKIQNALLKEGVKWTFN